MEMNFPEHKASNSDLDRDSNSVHSTAQLQWLTNLRWILWDNSSTRGRINSKARAAQLKLTHQDKIFVRYPNVANTERMQILKTKQTENTSEAESWRERDHLSAHFTLDLLVISASVLKGRTRDTNWLRRSAELFARFLVTKQENTERRAEQNENENDWKSCWRGRSSEM